MDVFGIDLVGKFLSEGFRNRLQLRLFLEATGGFRINHYIVKLTGLKKPPRCLREDICFSTLPHFFLVRVLGGEQW